MLQTAKGTKNVAKLKRVKQRNLPHVNQFNIHFRVPDNVHFSVNHAGKFGKIARDFIF